MCPCRELSWKGELRGEDTHWRWCHSLWWGPGCNEKESELSAASSAPRVSENVMWPVASTSSRLPIGIRCTLRLYATINSSFELLLSECLVTARGQVSTLKHLQFVGEWELFDFFHSSFLFFILVFFFLRICYCTELFIQHLGLCLKFCGHLLYLFFDGDVCMFLR